MGAQSNSEDIILSSQFWEPSTERGFLFGAIPKSPYDLSQSNCLAIKSIAELVPQLGAISDFMLEEYVADLPILHMEEMSPESTEVEALILALVNIAAHLIHRPFFSPRLELPPAIARPLWALSAKVGRPPSLTYASYVLANFTHPIRARMMPAEIHVAQTPTGTPDEEWFVAVHLAAETAGGEVVKAIRQLEEGLSAQNTPQIVEAIEAIESVLRFANEVMPTITERMDPNIFRNIIRPLLYGHKKIAFRGVPGEPQVSYVGETGAQSGMVRAADLALGVNHSEDIKNSLNHFLVCAPPIHRQFFEYSATIGDRLRQIATDARIAKARSNALFAMAEFRRTHLKVVKEYLVPKGEKLTERGTGGTDFTYWLQRIIDETK